MYMFGCISYIMMCMLEYLMHMFAYVLHISVYVCICQHIPCQCLSWLNMLTFCYICNGSVMYIYLQMPCTCVHMSAYTMHMLAYAGICLYMPCICLAYVYRCVQSWCTHWCHCIPESLRQKSFGQPQLSGWLYTKHSSASICQDFWPATKWLHPMIWMVGIC